MASEEERERWETDPEAAYEEAERRIAAARESGATKLNFSILSDDGALHALRTLPPTLQDLTNLQTLYLTSTQVAELAPLADLTNLQALSLDNTQVEPARVYRRVKPSEDEPHEQEDLYPDLQRGIS